MCNQRLLITLYTDRGGRIETSTDDFGNGVVDAVPDTEYKFVGWKKVDSDEILKEGTFEISESVSFIAKYEKK